MLRCLITQCQLLVGYKILAKNLCSLSLYLLHLEAQLLWLWGPKQSLRLSEWNKIKLIVILKVARTVKSKLSKRT